MSLHLDLHHTRGSFTLNLQATLDAPITGLYGPSGSGKTTLLHLIAGLLRPDRGCIRLDDNTLTDTQHGIHRAPEARHIGIVFQDGRLFPHMTVAQNLRFGMPTSHPTQRLKHVADLLEITRHLNRLPRELSGGERQRVALGRALLSHPRLLLLDEPFSAVDVALRQQILPFLRRIHEEYQIPMILISHDLPDILQLTDNLLLLREGAALGHGRYHSLIEQETLLDCMRGAGLMNILHLRVRAHRDLDGVTLLSPRQDQDRPILKGPYSPETPIGTQMHLALRPEDIALSDGPLESLSMQNQLPGTVKRVIAHPHLCLCLVDAGIEVLVEITRESATHMNLHPGSKVWCLFKARALHASATDSLPSAREETKTL